MSEVRYVEDVVITKKSAPRIQLIMNRVAELIEVYPQFAVSSILAKLTDWSPTSVKSAADKMGLNVTVSSRTNRASLGDEIQGLFFNPEVSDQELLEARALVQGVVNAVTEPIVATQETEEDEDPLG